MGGEESSFANIESYQELYQTSLKILKQTHSYKKTDPSRLFQELFLWGTHHLKYDWVTGIPLMIRKYFGKILEDVRTKSVQELFRILNLVVLKNEDTKDSLQNHETKFFRKLSISTSDKSLDASTMVRDSILFQDEVISSYINIDGSELGPDFRQSFLHNSITSDKDLAIKQTIFIENLSDEDQQCISYMMQFFNRFRIVLESIMMNANFCSLPLKHFGISLQEKRIRKNLKTSKEISQDSKLFEDTEEGEKARSIQKHNQQRLLKQVNSFINVYSKFIWNFYKLDQLENIKMANLITYPNIKSLVANAAWMKVSWIGQRGSEYEEELLRRYLMRFTKVHQFKLQVREQVTEVCRNMSLNPVKYLKEVSLVYRQMIKGRNICADDLIPLYHRMFYELAVMDCLKGKIRLIQIVNKICKQEKRGEIQYAWITWEATLEMLLREARKYKLSQL